MSSNIDSSENLCNRRKGKEYHPDCIVSTTRHGCGKIQVWGCMAAYGVGTLKLVCGHLDAPAYNFHPPSKGMDKGFVSLWKKLSFPTRWCNLPYQKDHKILV